MKKNSFVLIIIAIFLLLSSCNTHPRDRKDVNLEGNKIENYPNKFDRAFIQLQENLLIEVDTIVGQIFVSSYDSISGINFLRIYEMNTSFPVISLSKERLLYKEESKSKWLFEEEEN
jgi:predicted small secreted protein